MAGRKDKGGAAAPAAEVKTVEGDGIAKEAVAAEAGGGEAEITGTGDGQPLAPVEEGAAAPVDNGGESGDRPSGEPEGETGKVEAEDHITAFDRHVERLSRIAEEAEFESGTLVGDIRDGLLDIFKARPKLWSQMSESEQRDLARGLESVAKVVLKKLVIVLAEEENVSVHATLKGYAVDGETFKLKVVAKGDEDTAAELFRMDGHEVILIRADARRHHGQRSDGGVQADQPTLAFSDPPAKGAAADEIRTEPPHPADDSDLAGGDEDEEEAEAEEEELFRVTAIEDGATLYLTGDEPAAWSDKVEEGGSWSRETADQLASENDGEVVKVED